MEKIIAKQDNVTFKVVERVSKKGKPYKVVIAVINGKECRISFLDNAFELALIHAGVKFNY